MKNFREIYSHIKEKYSDVPEIFEETLKLVYLKVLKRGDVAFDIGAHTGKHTLPLSYAVGESGTIFAFEPIPEKFEVLRKKIGQSGLENINIFNVCCSKNNSLLEFTYLPDSPGKSSISIRTRIENSTEKKIKFKSLTIKLDDYFCDIIPQFIKIDVEGAEMFVLEGGTQIIERSRPIIHTELGIDTLDPFGVHPNRIYDFSIIHDYDVYDILGNHLVDASDFNDSIRAPYVYDYIWMPRGCAIKDELLKIIKVNWTR